MPFTNITYNVETKKISFVFVPDKIIVGITIEANFKLTSPEGVIFYGVGKTANDWLNVTNPDYNQPFATNSQNYVDFFDIPIDLTEEVISGNYVLASNQETITLLISTFLQNTIDFEILNYNILAGNVNVDLIENCNELLISNTTDEIQYFDITSLTNLGEFKINDTVKASTSITNNVFYNRLLSVVIATPLVNDIQVLQPYQYVKLVLKDQLYKITWKTTSGSLNTKYVAKDCNIKECLLDALNKILCTNVGNCDNSCDLILEYLKIKTASDQIYFLWNRWSQQNIMLDVSETSNYRLKEYSEWLKFIEEHCTKCKPKDDCGCH